MNTEHYRLDRFFWEEYDNAGHDLSESLYD